MPRIISLIPNLGSGSTHKIRDFDLRLGDCGIRTSEIYFLIFLENKEKDWSDPQSDSAIQPKARGLLHMEREYFAHHIWSGFRGLNTSQPQSNQKYLKDYLMYLKEGPKATRRMFWLFEVLEDALQSTRCLQVSAMKSSGACQTRDSGTAYRYRMF